jgi:hypothetical protein
MTTMVTRFDRADRGRVSGAETERPDPEVPQRARRRTFTVVQAGRPGRLRRGA